MKSLNFFLVMNKYRKKTQKYSGIEELLNGDKS